MTNKNNYAELRNEKKFISIESMKSIEKLFTSIGCKEIFNLRKVNTLYFDTYFHKNFFEAEDGVAWRNKVRMRWYGKIFNATIKPKIENKIKYNSHNFKIIKNLEIFNIKKTFNLLKFKDYIEKEKKNNNEINFYLNNLYPNLMVSYSRKYFVLNDIRITLDTDLKFMNLATINSFSEKNFLNINKKNIIELKFNDKHYLQASKITNILNNRLNKFSKYVTGLSETFY